MIPFVCFVSCLLAAAGNLEEPSKVGQSDLIKTDLLSQHTFEVLELSEEPNAIEPVLKFLEDPEHQFGARDVFEHLGSFARLPDKGANFGLTTSVYWFGLVIDPGNLRSDFVLNIAYPLLDHFDVYQFDLDSGEILLESKGGDRLVFDERYRKHRTLNSRLANNDGEESLVLIRVQTSGSVQLPATIYTEKVFGDHAATENAGLFFYYGLFGVMAIFNLVLFLSTRADSYGPYVGYLVCFLAFQMNVNGTLFQWVIPNSPILVSELFIISFFGTATFGSLFVWRFNLSAFKDTRLSHIYTWVCWFFGFCTIGLWLLPYGISTKVAAVTGLATPILWLFTGWAALRRGYSPAKFFVLAWVIYILGIILWALKSFGVIPANFITEYAVQVGSALEVMLLTLALGDKMNQVYYERDALNLRTLEQQTKLVAESEKRVMAEAAHAELAGAKAEDERRARIDAETRIAVFSNAIHHLNNPLSHLQGAQNAGNSSFEGLTQTVLSLLPENPDDEELMEVRAALETDIDGYRTEARVAREALTRASSAVHVLRTITGVDGASFAEHTFESLKASVEARFSETESLALDWKSDGTGVSVIGAIEVYSQALWLILDGLAQHAVQRVDLELDAGSEENGFHRLKIIGASEAACGQVEDSLGELIQQLLLPYKCRLVRQRSELHLSIRATAQILTGEQQTKAV